MNLTQEEVGFLLGVKTGTVASQHETGIRVPSLDAALAYEVIYGAPVRKLFRGRFVGVRNRIVARAKELRTKLMRTDATGKVDVLAALIEGADLLDG